MERAIAVPAPGRVPVRAPRAGASSGPVPVPVDPPSGARGRADDRRRSDRSEAQDRIVGVADVGRLPVHAVDRAGSQRHVERARRVELARQVELDGVGVDPGQAGGMSRGDGSQGRSGEDAGRSALMSAGLTLPEKVTVISSAGQCTSTVWPFALNWPVIGTSEVVTTRKAPPIGMPPVPLNSKAPMSRGPKPARPKPPPVILTCELPRKSVVIAVASHALSIAAEADGQLEVGVEEEVGRAVRTGPGVDREDEGRVADEVAQIVDRGLGGRSQRGRAEPVLNGVHRRWPARCRWRRCRRTGCSAA